jgi:catechol 2,3-dioxygenase-like lactoylglutathione lyase family enzyme
MKRMADDGAVYVRYLIDDIDAAVDFYVRHLGFELVWSAGAAFAEIVRGNLHLLLSGPASSAARPMPDGRKPEPGGWNRIHLLVGDIAGEAARLRAAGVTLRSEIVTGPGGAQLVFDDPSGNPVELFQSSR